MTISTHSEIMVHLFLRFFPIIRRLGKVLFQFGADVQVGRQAS